MDGWKFADQSVGGDAFPGETSEALVERQHVNDSYGQDSQFDDHPIAEYKFFFAHGELDVSGAHDLDGLRERNNVAPEHSGPMAVGNLIVQDGTAIWEVSSNVGLGPLIKALKSWTKDAGWDWGGVTDMKGEPLGDPEKLARKRYYLSVTLNDAWTEPKVELCTRSTGAPNAERSVIDVVGRVAAWRGPGVAANALQEFADDHNLRLAEYPGGGSAMDYIKNHSPMGEDLELKNIPGEKPEEHELERFHKDRDRNPEGIFKCPTCGRLIHRWNEYLQHRREEEPPGDSVEDGHFPTIEESTSEPWDFTEARVANVVVHNDIGFGENYRTREEGDPLASLAMIYDADNDTLNIGAHDDIHHGDMWASGKITGDNAYAGWISPTERGHQWYDGFMPEKTKQRATELLHQHLGYPTKNFDDSAPSWQTSSTRSKIASNFLHDASRLANLAGFYTELPDPSMIAIGSPAIQVKDGYYLVDQADAHHADVISHFGIDPEAVVEYWWVDDDHLWFNQDMDHEENAAHKWRMSVKAPKDMFTEPVPFIYDIKLDKIFVGHPGARHGEIEAPAGTKFTPGGIVEGEYQPGGKVVVESQSDTPYSIRHMVGLWYYQHPEFEVTGIMMTMPDGKQRKIAGRPGNDEDWKWQQGLCGTYACALQREYPELRFGYLDDGAHFFAHDDVYAYDSLGRHPLPYRGIEGNMYPALDSIAKDWGVPDEEAGPEGPETNMQRALEHIRRTSPLQRDFKHSSGKNIGAYVIGQASQDPAVHAAWQALQAVGGEVYGVGGVVRDALLGKPSKDVDLLVSGLPIARVDKTLRKLPGRVDLTGKDFGVFRYNYQGNEVEIALPRTEKSTGERRVDFEVSVDHLLPIEKDLERRDFTANAIAVNLRTGELVDPFGGQADIANSKLKTVHSNSFPEDPTRLVRGLVAHSRHGLHPDPKTMREMQAHAPDLAKESPERIQAELDKLFSSDNPSAAIRLAHQTGMLKYLLPEVEAAWDFDQNNKHHNYALGEHLLNVLDHTAAKTNDPDLRLAALLHDIGKPASAWDDPETGQSHFYLGPNGEGADHDALGAELAESRMRELRYPVARINRVRDLISRHMYPDFSSPKGARKFLNQVGPEHAHDLMLLREADRAGKGTDEYQDTKTPVDQQRWLVDEALEAKMPTDRSALAVNGNDLMGLGLQPGPAFTSILQALTELVLEHPQTNEKHTLLNYVRHELMPNA